MINKPSTQFISTLNSKQNSIFIGLLSVLTEIEANEVMENWSTYFNETGSIFNGLNSFAKEICQNYGVVDQQRDLLRALHRTLLHTGNEPDINGLKENLQSKSYIESTKDLDDNDYSTLFTEQVISSPEFLTFQSLFLNILDLLEQSENDFNGKLNSFLTELTYSMPWSEGQQNQLISLINTGKTIQLRTYLPDQLKSFLKHFYSWLDDEIGSINATQVKSKAVELVKNQPKNLNYNVKKFL
jgi:hypothetical protein